MSRPIAPEAGHSIETAMRKGKAMEKLCLKCGCRIEKRKTYCSPCYGFRYEENIAANRYKYQKPSRRGAP